MAKISTYASPTPPLVTDYLLGTDVADNYSTKNFKISDVFSLTVKGSFGDTTNQSCAFTATPTGVKFNSSLITNGTVVVTNIGGLPASFTVSRNGIYKVSFLPQFYKSTAGDANVDIWIRVNGTNLVGSNRTLVVKGSGVYTITNLEYYVSMSAYEYFEIVWMTSDTGAQLTTSAATGYKPSGYSAAALIGQV